MNRASPARMEPKASTPLPFKLELVDDVPQAVRAAPPHVEPIAPPAVAPTPFALTPVAPTPANDVVDSGVAAAPHASVDRFLAQAMRERDAGNVDGRLWARSLALANGDEAAATQPYLRARAAMLKLAASRAPAVAAPHVPLPHTLIDEEDDESAPPPRVQPRPRALMLAGAGVAVAVLAVVAWMLLAPGGDEAAKVQAMQAKPSPKAVEAPPQAAPAVDPGPELAARVAALKQQGNWNVLVLHAAEWTRRKPENPDAWAELAGGYMKLRQVDEALEAAQRAVALEPKHAAAQRLLAGIFVALDRPADALAAAAQAVELDAQDAEALVVLGGVHARLARWPEARAAYERALAVDPVNVAASCGIIETSRAQGRAKDAEPFSRALQAAGIGCGESAAVAAAPAAAVAAPGAAKAVPTRR